MQQVPSTYTQSATQTAQPVAPALSALRTAAIALLVDRALSA
jgi:hypothetical protein